MAESRWQPDQKAVEDEYANIGLQYGTRRTQGKVPEDYKHIVMEFARIAVFLQDEQAVLGQLKKLNALLLDEAKQRDPPMNEQKLLRDVLERELAKLGFQPDFAKATDYLPPKVFRETVREGIIIKDPGAGIAHGEFTHAIQWLIIGWQQNDSNFLKDSAFEIFKQLGSERSVIYTRSDGSEKNLWDLIVDGLINNCKDFRCPEFLLLFIKNRNDPELSFLRKLCVSRIEKRELEKQESDLSSSTLFSNSQEKRQNKRIYPKKEYEVSDKNKNLLIARKK